MAPSGQMMLLSNRPQINYNLVNNAGSQGGAQSIDRIYVQKAPSVLPSLVEGAPSQQSRKNLAYINISGDGAKPVGYLGLRKAEKDLIMRRYKQNHHDPLHRVALIYGNGQGQGNQPQYHYSYGGHNAIYSPYLANQMPHSIIQNGGATNNGGNSYGIIKRNKYAVSPIMEEGQTVGGQAAIRLPKISAGLSRVN